MKRREKKRREEEECEQQAAKFHLFFEMHYSAGPL